MVFKEVGVYKDEEEWKQESDGESIQGTLTRKKEKQGKNESYIYEVDCVDGSKKWFWGSTVLDDKMTHINEGDTIRITYQGIEEGKNYKKFYVEKDEPKNT